MKSYIYGYIWRNVHGHKVGREHVVRSYSALRAHASAEIGKHIPKPTPDCVPSILWREVRGRK